MLVRISYLSVIGIRIVVLYMNPMFYSQIFIFFHGFNLSPLLVPSSLGLSQGFSSLFADVMDFLVFCILTDMLACVYIGMDPHMIQTHCK
jgi:hypothetical protein